MNQPVEWKVVRVFFVAQLNLERSGAESSQTYHSGSKDLLRWKPTPGNPVFAAFARSRVFDATFLRRRWGGKPTEGFRTKLNFL